MVEAAGEKGEQRVEQEHLDHALGDFSGYIAADELYDGPFCVLSLVDNRNFRRLSYRVLDHRVAAADITGFLSEFKKQLDARGLALRGITTDGSPLYPQPIALVFGTVPHQICRVRTRRNLHRRIALDLLRETRAPDRTQTTATLHAGRAASG